MFTARIVCYVIRLPGTPFRNGFHANWSLLNKVACMSKHVRCQTLVLGLMTWTHTDSKCPVESIINSGVSFESKDVRQNVLRWNCGLKTMEVTGCSPKLRTPFYGVTIYRSTIHLISPEIVPTWKPNRNKNRCRNFTPLPHPFRCTPREHSWSSSVCTIHIWLTNIQGNYIRHIRGRHSNICNS